MNDQKSNYYTQLILKALLNKEMVTTGQLAEEIGLSEKTIRTKVEVINNMLLDNQLGEICKKPRIGIWLNADAQQRLKLNSLINNSTNMDVLQNDQVRTATALKLILKSTKNNTLTTKQLASQLYLSVPTTLKVINDCRSWLKLFNIELNVVRNKGLELAYNEVSYRLALKHFILKFDTETNVEESILFFMPGLDLDAIRRGIMETEKEWSFEFAEESFNEVLVYASLAIYQNQQENGRKLKFSDEELEMLQKYNEYSFAEAIFKKLGAHFNMTLPTEEKAFLSIQILCFKLIDSGYSADSGEVLREYDNKLQEFVRKIISVVSNVLNVDLTHDDALYHGLLIHMRPTLFRLRYERGHTNGLTSYIKTEYKKTFRVAWLISVLFEEYFDLKVSEDELGYIVLYIQSALERNENPVRTMLVSASGMGINQMLCDKICRSSSLIHSVKVVSVHDFKIEKVTDVDLILTTRELQLNDPRIVEIDDFLSDASIQKINHWIRNTILNKVSEAQFDADCHQLFEPDLIFTHLKIDDKPALLKYLCDHLVRKGYVTRKYVKTVLDREAFTPTSIGNGVAIPHGDQNEINEARVVIATLEKPILWDSEMVDVIFLLVVKMTNDFESRRTQAFYKQYIKLVGTDEQVNVLRNFQTNVDFYKYLIK